MYILVYLLNLSVLAFVLLFPFANIFGVSQPNLLTANHVVPSFPTRIPFPSPTIAPQPTKAIIPTPTKASLPTTTPISAPSASSSTTMEDFFLQKINDFRHSKGLSSVKKNLNTCNFAKIRAQEITSGFNHDGFTNRINSKSLPYPSYSLVTENIAMNSNYQDVVNQWANSAGHAANMSADTTYACVQASGNYYAYEGWKP